MNKEKVFRMPFSHSEQIFETEIDIRNIFFRFLELRNGSWLLPLRQDVRMSFTVLKHLVMHIL
jgi:hypothetical protein